jgi:hypothetical protein
LRTRTLILGAALAVLLSCATTSIVDSWTAPGIGPADIDFDHVVAIAAVTGDSRQRIAEDALANSITNVRVTPAYTFVDDSDRRSADRMHDALTKAGIDGAITVRLVAVEDKQTYVPGTTHVYGGGYRGYYGGVGTVVYEPGYMRTDTYVRVETSLYDVEGSKLLWTGISETMNPSSVDKLIEGIVKAAAKQLAKEGLVQ